MKKALMSCAVLALLGGCSTVESVDHMAMESMVEQFIADQALQNEASVSAYNIDSYRYINKNYLTMRASPSRHFLIEVATTDRCDELMEEQNQALALRRGFGNSLQAGSDFVYIDATVPTKCYISKIYPLDYEQVVALRHKVYRERDAQEHLLTDKVKS